MSLDPRKLMIGRPLHVGYLRHEQRYGPQTYHVEVVEAVSGQLVYFEAVTSQANAISRAGELTGLFAECLFIGQINGGANVT